MKKICSPARAFSLVEMLMALLVASLLLAALAPVMTKKLGENVDVNLFGNIKNMEACAFVANNAGVDVTDRTCTVPDGVNTASAIIVSGGGGGAGATSSVSDPNLHIGEIYGTKENATYIFGDNDIVEFTITKDMSDFEIELISGGEGGGTGNSNGGGAPLSQADCTALGNGKTDTTGNTGTSSKPIFRYDGLSNICVTAYNQVSNPNNYKTYETINGYTDTNCTSNYTHTSASCNSNQNSMPYAYSGCKRPVCTHVGGEAACAKLTELTGMDWELPKNAEIANWGKTVAGHDYPLYVELALCTNDNSGTPFSQVAWCKRSESYVFSGIYCPDCSINNWYAVPDTVWTKEASSTTSYYGGYLSTRWGIVSGNSAGAPLSVRCVTNEAPKFIGYTGAGGTSGQYAKIKIPDELLKKAFEKTYDETTNTYKDNPVDTITLRLQVGGGGKPSSLSDAKKYTGAVSSVSLWKSGNRVFQIMLYGGGYTDGDIYYTTIGSATTSKNGVPYTTGAGGPTNKVVYYNLYSDNIERRTRCYGDPLTYFAGENILVDWKESKFGNTLTTSEGVSNGTSLGAGGAAYWGGMYGVRGTTSGTSQPGSGGKGGYCTQGSDRNNPVCTSATSGSAGAARFSYKRNYPGIGGNGGNAGSVLHVKNIPVTKGEVIKVQVGAGGSGGIANADGGDGGSSYVEFANGRKYEVVGGKGGKTGVAANPSAVSEADKFAKQGSLQAISESSIITAETKTNLGLLDSKNYEIFPNPSNNDEKLLAQGKQAVLNPNDVTVYKAGGGNGGVNIKLTPLAGTKGIPCGAFSNSAINIGAKKYGCGTSDFPTTEYDAMRLSRVISEDELKNKASDYSKYYAPGATGGGGGAWSNDYKTGNTPKTGQGADGMGGYVLIYFK